MPRIPESEIDRIKRETDLAALVRSRGIELNKHGGNGHFAGRCPFHDEDEASFIVTPAKGLYHCMGCGAAGNAIQFVQRYDGVSFRHAFELLNEGSPAFAVHSDTPAKRCTIRRLEPPVESDAEDAELFAQVVDYYHERLLQTPAALDYLKGRGLYNEEAMDRFRLGFADRTLGLRLPHSRCKDGEVRKRLQKLGLLRESGHEHFNGSLVMPVFDENGQVSEMYGRKINDKLRKGTPLHLYLPGPHAGIWNAEALQSPEVVLCEAPLDALTFWVNGIRNVTFIYGTEGFPDYLLDALVKHRVKAVRLAYDADDAGNRAARRDAERLAAHGIEAYRVRFPHGMDANEYALKVKPAAKSLAVAVKGAAWMGVGGKAVRGKRQERGGEENAPQRTQRAQRSGSKGHGAWSGEEKPSCVRERASSSESLAANLVAETAANEESESAPSASSAVESPLVRRGDYHVATFGSREYRVGGLEKNNSLEVLKVSVRLRHGDEFHLDSFDMTRDTDRRRFIERAAEETGLEKDLIKRDLGRLLLALENEQEQRLFEGLTTDNGPQTTDLSPQERDEALTFLRSPDLVHRIGEIFDECGLVGEATNRLAAYLACTSRKLDRPLAVIIQSTSAAGKSTLMEAVLAMFPEEERVKYSAMTGQSLYYLGETDLKHKILAIVEEEGAEKASYALKLLQSEGELTIASTGKDPVTGRMETQEYHVEGPVMIFLTTTAIDIDEELQNRCLTLSVDESKEQTERIHALQRQARTLEGLRLKKKRQRLLTLLRNAQRLLHPVDVVNPYADQLTFTAERTRTRRDHEKYLTLIDAIALLHQYQRGRGQMSEVGGQEEAEYISVTLEDIELANRLAPELLGRSLDELPPQTRRVYEDVKAIVRDRMRAEEIEQRFALFSRRGVRQRLGWSVTQVRLHLERLRELEYIATRSGRSGTAFQYELLTDCNEAEGTHHIGLLDVEKLRVRRQPVGAGEHLSGGCRTRGRHVQRPEESLLMTNLSACSDRTSGAPAVIG